MILSRSIRKGRLVKKFENRFREYIGSSHTVAVSSGRFALYLILKNLGLKEGDGILLSAYNFRGVPASLLKEGFRPVFVDADEETYQIDIKKIEEKIDNSTRAIIATHLFGQPCNVDEVLDIARKHNLFVIEDSAHSLGGFYKKRHTGTIGNAGFFSFSGSKTLNTSFGGMVVTNNFHLADKIRDELLNYDYPQIRTLVRERLITYIYALLTNRVIYTMIQYPISLLMSFFDLDPLELYKSFKKSEVSEKKLKFTNFQALIGLGQMNIVENLIYRRKKIADEFFRRLDPSISIQKIPQNCEPNYFMIPIRARDKMKVFKKLLLKGIDSNLNYASDCSYLAEDRSCLVAKRLANSLLTIQLPFNLKEEEVSYIAQVLCQLKDLLY